MSHDKSSYNIANSRNYGFWNEAEQDALSQSTVAIAGVGGDGFQLGLKLAMMGVGEINVADPEPFEPENSNRVLAATTQNHGRNKAEVFREMVGALPRDVKVNIFTDGVTEDNVDDFMYGADLVLDESELRYLHVATMIARTAIKYEIPNLLVLNVGFAGVATSFHPEAGAKSFEDLMGIPKGMSLDELKDKEFEFDRIPYMPPYGDIDTFYSVRDGSPLPSISQGVDVASAIGSTEAFLHLTANVRNNRKSPTWYKKYRYMDALTNKSGTIKHPRVSHYIKLGSLYGRSKMGINPKASYRIEDIARRNQLQNDIQ